MRKVVKIEIGLENVDVIEFPEKDIGHIQIKGIHSEIQTIGSGTALEFVSCTDFLLELKSDHEHHEFGMDNDSFKKSAFSRLSDCDDITSCELFYDDGTSEDIFVPWEDATPGGEVNVYQSSAFKENGSLCIYIGKNGKVADYL